MKHYQVIAVALTLAVGCTSLPSDPVSKAARRLDLVAPVSVTDASILPDGVTFSCQLSGKNGNAFVFRLDENDDQTRADVVMLMEAWLKEEYSHHGLSVLMKPNVKKQGLQEKHIHAILIMQALQNLEPQSLFRVMHELKKKEEDPTKT